MRMKLSEPLGLSSGLKLNNRIAKAAMTEQLCKSGTPHGAYVRLYRAFVDGGVGVIITGNMMVDKEQKEHPRNVVIDDNSALPEFKQVAAICRGKVPLVAQLNHPGRQA